ncbi:MAG: hypothetical protein AB7S77_14570 [Desulfatirhabdiaceae bacterium]
MIGLLTPMNENKQRTAEYRTRNSRRMNPAYGGPAMQPETSNFDISCSIFDIRFLIPGDAFSRKTATTMKLATPQNPVDPVNPVQKYFGIVWHSDIIFKQASSSMPKSINLIQPSGNSISYLILRNKHVMDSNLTAYAKTQLDCHPDIFFEPY